MKAQPASSRLRLLAVAASPRTCPATSIPSSRAWSASSETSSPVPALTSPRRPDPAASSKLSRSSWPAILPSSRARNPIAQAGIRLFHGLNSTASIPSWHQPARPVHPFAAACRSHLSGAPHFTATSTRGHATCALAAEDHLGSFSTTHNTTNTFEMGDRDLLPDSFKAGHYDLKLTNLDFKDWSYNGSVTYAILPLMACPPRAVADPLPTASLGISPNQPRRSSSMPSS